MFVRFYVLKYLRDYTFSTSLKDKILI